MKEVWISSTMDGTRQPSLFYQAEGENRPLLVGLHTWSYDRYNQVKAYLPYAERLNWHLLLPEFRGPNLAQNPNCQDACGSPKAKQDILDAAGYEYAPNIAACMGGKTPGDFFPEGTNPAYRRGLPGCKSG